MQKHIATHFPIAIVTSCFNHEVTEKLYQGAYQRLLELGFNESAITSLWVPGAVEIPLTVMRLAKTDRYEAIVALGAVIRGETSHFDYVCEQVSWGCQKVALKYDVPVIFGVLTTESEAQAFARAGGDYGHKGIESVDAACEMVGTLRRIERL